MATPQSGILPDGNPYALFLTLLVDDAAACRGVVAEIPRMTDEVARIDSDAGLRSVIAIGADAWDRLYAGARPDGLAAFERLDDGGRVAPATAADLLLHLRCDRFDLCFEVARRVRQRLAGAVRVVEEVHGFRYLDSRDLTGFVDGTENPQGDDDRRAVALLADGPFAGGSHVDIQRYIHDLAKWQRLDVAEQEQIIARTKEDNVEFAAADKPPTAHIKRVSIKGEGGESLNILRHSMPYGTASEHGLYFIAYASRRDVFARMLEQMIVADGDGHYDHLVDYSQAVTGASFFAPARDWLEASGA